MVAEGREHGLHKGEIEILHLIIRVRAIGILEVFARKHPDLLSRLPQRLHGPSCRLVKAIAFAKEVVYYK